MGWRSLLSLLWMLLGALVIVVLAYLFTRYVVGNSKVRMIAAGKRHTIQAIKVVTKVPISRDGQLLLVQVGERYFLLGNTAAGITNLAEFTQEEAAAWEDREEPPDGGQPPSFREAFQKTWKQWVKR
ncbi:MAG: flagellar biosynthetic protein FliO [Dorea sp.]|nr:flagellar biosynthetic protein FliO [Dorea sp.]